MQKVRRWLWFGRPTWPWRLRGACLARAQLFWWTCPAVLLVFFPEGCEGPGHVGPSCDRRRAGRGSKTWNSQVLLPVLPRVFLEPTVARAAKTARRLATLRWGCKTGFTSACAARAIPTAFGRTAPSNTLRLFVAVVLILLRPKSTRPKPRMQAIGGALLFF